jgi:Fe-S-cluster-containing hydrogenase component 2
MARKVIFCDSEKCTGCGICELICSAVKEKKFEPSMSRIRVVKIEPFVYMALTCRLCEDPPCVFACPRGALNQEEKTNAIKPEDDKCIGCSWCLEACEFGAILLSPNKKGVIICDLCVGQPACVEFCPRKALAFFAPEQRSSRARKSVVEALCIG